MSRQFALLESKLLVIVSSFLGGSLLLSGAGMTILALWQRDIPPALAAVSGASGGALSGVLTATFALAGRAVNGQAPGSVWIVERTHNESRPAS